MSEPGAGPSLEPGVGLIVGATEWEAGCVAAGRMAGDLSAEQYFTAP